MAHARTTHCCLCGEMRRPTQAPVESFGTNECIQIAEHRTLMDGRWEVSPQLMVHVGVWRNGGTARGETHICDGCIVVGLQAAKRFIDSSLAALNTDQRRAENAE